MDCCAADEATPEADQKDKKLKKKKREEAQNDGAAQDTVANEGNAPEKKKAKLKSK